MALLINTMTNTVSGMPIYKGISYMPQKPYRLLTDRPATGISTAAATWAANLTLAPRPTRSSMMPTTYMMARLKKKRIDHRLSGTRCCSAGSLSNVKIAMRAAITMLGIKVMPPSLGISLWCNLRWLGISYSPLVLQKLSVSGMNTNPQSTLIRKVPKSRIISIVIL